MCGSGVINVQCIAARICECGEIVVNMLGVHGVYLLRLWGIYVLYVVYPLYTCVIPVVFVWCVFVIVWCVVMHVSYVWYRCVVCEFHVG